MKMLFWAFFCHESHDVRALRFVNYVTSTTFHGLFHRGIVLKLLHDLPVSFKQIDVDAKYHRDRVASCICMF